MACFAIRKRSVREEGNAQAGLRGPTAIDVVVQDAAKRPLKKRCRHERFSVRTKDARNGTYRHYPCRDARFT